MIFREHTSTPTTFATARLGLLVAGDVVTFLLFAAIGRASHAEAASLDAIVEVAKTAAPFMAGWFVVAPWLGLFRRDVAEQPRVAAKRVALAWLLAEPVGLLLRALQIGRGSPLSFAIVTFITALLMLLGWRSAYAWLARRSASHE